jgi:hypothetical protein
MTFRPNLLAVLLLAWLPAVGVSIPATHLGFVASYFFACPGTVHAPRVRTQYADKDRPAPRPASSPVLVFYAGKPPVRRYRIVGTVEVLATSAYTGTDVLTDYAIRSARRMGGDAIVEVDLQDAASTQPKAGESGLLVLNGVVARWD